VLALAKRNVQDLVYGCGAASSLYVAINTQSTGSGFSLATMQSNPDSSHPITALATANFGTWKYPSSLWCSYLLGLQTTTAGPTLRYFTEPQACPIHILPSCTEPALQAPPSPRGTVAVEQSGQVSLPCCSATASTISYEAGSTSYMALADFNSDNWMDVAIFLSGPGAGTSAVGIAIHPGVSANYLLDFFNLGALTPRVVGTGSLAAGVILDFI
jgi:hypothetical protein